ncbi:MAG: tetratricopeptide repeat protein [Pelovirga sp.]
MSQFLNQSSENPQAQSSIIDLSKKARQKLRARCYSDAGQLFAEGLELEPDNPYLLSGMGDASREMGHFEVAEECYLKLLHIDEKNLFALRGLGDVYKKLNRHTDAVTMWERYLHLRPRDKHVMSRIADSAKVLLQFERAEQMYLSIIAFAPDDRFALSGLADLQHRLGKDQDAIRIYEKILGFDDKSLHILTILGKLCWRVSDFDKGEIYFRRALEIDPDNPYALYGLGNCHRWHKRYQDAIEVWQKILEDSEGTQALHTRMGDAYYHIGMKEEAARSYRRSISFGRDPFSLAGLICLSADTGDLDAAIATFLDLVVADDDPLYQLDMLSRRFIRAGQQSIMEEFYRYLLSGNHRDCTFDTDLAAALQIHC